MVLPSAAASAGVFLVEATSWPFLDPILLSCAKKSGVEPPRRICEELLRCGAAQQKGCDPFEILGVPDLLCLGYYGSSACVVNALLLNWYCVPVRSVFNDLIAERQVLSLWPSQGTFALQKSL